MEWAGRLGYDQVMVESSADAPAFPEASAEVTLRQDEAAIARAQALSGPRIYPPARLPGYDVQRSLGEGAYGSVWLALAQNTGKLVAIKFYSHRPGLDWSLLNREVEKLAVLYTCRDIIGLIDVGWDSDPPFYVMEYLENGSLAKLLETGVLSSAEAIRIVTGVTKALVHAHRNGILHCDVKPANILLDGDFNPRLADFGQSRLSHEQNPALGTLFYMAPEQADLHAIPDARWDVYALGALLYRALCGDAPYRNPANESRLNAAGSLEERLLAYRNLIRDCPRPQKHRHLPGVDNQLADIVDRCLEVEPERRFENAQAVMKALEKRVRDRSRRPLIALGVLAPVLLLLTMIPIAVQAMNNAVRLAESNLSRRAMESDVVTAKILALAVAKGLDRRQHDLLDVAAEPQLRALVVDATGKPRSSPARRQLDQFLNQRKAEADAGLFGSPDGALDESWFLTDDQGTQLWRFPLIEKTIDKNYAWRDYFHGGGVDYAESSIPSRLQPIVAPHVSRVFRSRSTGRNSVAQSVPVWDAEHQRVVGVLARTFRLGRLLNDYKSQILGDGRADIHRVIALADSRTWQLLDHPWMTAENLKGMSDADLQKLTLNAGQREQMAGLRNLIEHDGFVNREDRILDYRDPVGAFDPEYSMEWLAAFWPVGNTGWMAVVQERRDEALQPVREIRHGLILYAVIGLSVCSVLVVTLWYFVLRALGISMLSRKRRHLA